VEGDGGGGKGGGTLEKIGGRNRLACRSRESDQGLNENRWGGNSGRGVEERRFCIDARARGER